MKALDDCVAACCETRQRCLRTLQVCLNKGGKFADSRLGLRLTEAMRLCQLCADCCTTASDVLVAVCEQCAGECEETARCADALAEPELRGCADLLRRCAGACRLAARAAAASAGGPGTRSGRKDTHKEKETP